MTIELPVAPQVVDDLISRLPRSSFINGHFIDGEPHMHVVNPATGEDLLTMSAADPRTSGDAALTAACTAGTAWAESTPRRRSETLRRAYELCHERADDLALTMTLEMGKPLAESYGEVTYGAEFLRWFSEEAVRGPGRARPAPGSAGQDMIVTSQPVGPCLLITPWNYPILQLCWKLAPALATGNVVIVKPSEVTPLSTIYLVHMMLEVGFPSGSIQLLTASGASIGSVLTESPDVDLVSFTGGLQTGRSIIRSCAETVKRCTVELGGKNPNIVFADCDLDWAIDNVTTAVFVHSGQVCSAGARLIVEESMADKLVNGVVERAQRIVMGNGLDAASETGPLVSAEHRAKIEAYVKLAQEEGAVIRCGGVRPDPVEFPHLAQGYFFLPTVLDKCDRTMRVVQEESFGPILTVERFPDGDEETAIMLANDTKYGLAGGVQSKDQARAERVARRLRHGTVWTNTYGLYTAQSEWGGYGMSGNGRELGSKGLDEYIEVKHIWSESKPAMMDWFKGQGKKHNTARM